MDLKRLLKQLKRHPAYTVLAGYIAFGWLVIQVITTTFPIFGIPNWVARVVIAFLGVGFLTVAGWAWTSERSRFRHKSGRQRKIAAGQVVFFAAVIIFAGVVTWYVIRPFKFKRDVAGILVLRINGDDDANSLQREWAASLNAELAKDEAEKDVQVVRSEDYVDESRGISDAHRTARSIGRRRNAFLVVWGEKTSSNHFFPRITVVREQHDVQLAGERTLEIQTINEINLPHAMVGQPLYLAHFIAGFRQYDERKYKEALRHFSLAVHSPEATPPEKADLLFVTGTTRLDVGVGQKEMSEQLTQAVQELSEAVEFYRQDNDRMKLARAENNLGNAYGELPTGDRTANVKHAIACYEAALHIYSQKEQPLQWAQTQNNIGTTYHDLPSGNRSENLQKEIAAYEAALLVYSENAHPYEWARAQNNLGTAYGDMPTGDPKENFRRAIDAYNKALRVRTEQRYALDWAQTQNNLGIAYFNSPVGEKEENVKKAIEAFQAALRIRTEKDSPRDWAASQNSLGVAFAALETGDQRENAHRAIDALQAALRVRTEAAFPLEWAQAQTNLGIGYAKLAGMGDIDSFWRAIEAYNASLRVHTESKVPVEWGFVQNNLGELYRTAPTGEPRMNLEKAMKHFENALRVFPEADFPEYHRAVMQNISETNDALKQLKGEGRKG